MPVCFFGFLGVGRGSASRSAVRAASAGMQAEAAELFASLLTKRVVVDAPHDV